MIFILHRYIFRELAKVFVMAALALTVMLSIGSILGPVQEYGVGPRQVIHLMGYFLPITLTFVLPIAALFAAALVYGRFASDNELDACRASGISLLGLVYPGLALALIVSIANLVLSFHVMPAFVHRAEKSLKADAKQILFRNIRRRGYYKLPPDGEYLIYADLADSQSNTLSGVVVMKILDGVMERIITAETARVLFNPLRRFNEVQISAHNTYRIESTQRSGFFAERLSVNAPFGSLLGDDIKFKKLDEMKRIRDVDLMLFDPIAKLAYKTYGQLIAELLADDIVAKTADPHDNYYRSHTSDRVVEFIATQCTPSSDYEKAVRLSREVVAIESDLTTGQNLRTMRCKEARLHIEGQDLAPTLTMELDDPVWQTPDGQKGVAASPVRIRGLIIPQTVDAKAAQFRNKNSLNAEKLAWHLPPLHAAPGSKLATFQSQLQRKIRRTLAEIEAETHSRLVFGVGCISMIMIGIGLGIRFKGGHLLSAFGVSCLPAALLMVCILMGKNIAKNVGSQVVSGTLLMWVGLGVLSLLALEIYRR
ncbi:MAG: LptF/LptG family permease, partial [Planctomycetota bacterium]